MAVVGLFVWGALLSKQRVTQTSLPWANGKEWEDAFSPRFTGSHCRHHLGPNRILASRVVFDLVASCSGPVLLMYYLIGMPHFCSRIRPIHAKNAPLACHFVQGDTTHKKFPTDIKFAD